MSQRKPIFGHAGPNLTLQKALPHAVIHQDIGVNDFYEEIFKSWSLKIRRLGSSSSVSSHDAQVIELEDSGDEAGDLSIILEVKVKKDPEELAGNDLKEKLPVELAAVDPYLEAGMMSAELQDYTESTMALLNEAMNAEAEEEHDASSIYLEPEYFPETVTDAKEVETGHADQPRHPAVPTEAEVPPACAPSKGFKPIDGKACTVKDVEERIRFLQRLGVNSISFVFVCFVL